MKISAVHPFLKAYPQFTFDLRLCLATFFFTNDPLWRNYWLVLPFELSVGRIKEQLLKLPAEWSVKTSESKFPQAQRVCSAAGGSGGWRCESAKGVSVEPCWQYINNL